MYYRYRRGRFWAFSGREVGELLISWGILGVVFGRAMFGSYSGFSVGMGLALLGLAFVPHELSHKFAAIRFGRIAEYRMWTWGLLLAVFLVAIGSPIIFAAPGAVYITSSYDPFPWRARREDGLISLAGPLANAVFAAGSYLAYAIGIAPFLFGYLFYVNLFLGSFNMLPIPPLDGSKVFSWNKVAWLVLAIAMWVPLLYVTVGIP
ncbi:MAG: hypothetical protein ACP5UI_00435 [Thermoprotei archaeon]|nr:hypothetical protein [TACK group archaeon]